MPVSVKKTPEVQQTTDSPPSIFSPLHFLRESTILLGPISLPPSVAQRRHIPRLSLVLSGISLQDLRTCALVSRSFRYAGIFFHPYLSAFHQLSRKFAGARLQTILLCHSSKMTNFWPYLHLREQEMSSRKRIYEASFLGRALKGRFSIANSLWSSPDNDKQIIIAIRFLLTKLFFLVSLGHGGEEPGMGKCAGVVRDAQEIVKGEIWRITFHSSSGIRFFHIIEATCEVVGEATQGSQTTGAGSPSINLRADWSSYIANFLENTSVRSRPDAIQGCSSLVDHLQWTNHEEYTQGISQLWLARVKNEGNVGIAKLTCAQRYVLACVAFLSSFPLSPFLMPPYSVSGPWLSAHRMLQDFNGLPDGLQPVKESKHHRVNLFLPAHHHVESVHFTSSNGSPLHPALAIVQTPGREYFILKDNGMQVGCEEEGVAEVWMQIIGCSQTGCAT
ncbi:hypothetical protein M413DRAFT_69460 [Hebeloma cylindrosporum]|uniref:F-box domain-containing protein n=1 Tax=Hebeloma cylindrosporum TaxID=76867 RepID=A0A0C2Y0F7_HEBCY|nr:hypothetical protein M413DRAFT_69460 [Hebeloma cylindrosporum h7]